VLVGSDEIEQNLRQSTLIALFGKNDIPGGEGAAVIARHRSGLSPSSVVDRCHTPVASFTQIPLPRR
jgi:hypothetical protein